MGKARGLPLCRCEEVRGVGWTGAAIFQWAWRVVGILTTDPVLVLVWSLSRLLLFGFAVDCIARRASLSIEFFRQEHWSGQPFPFPWALPDPGIEPASPALQAASLPLSQPGVFQLKCHGVSGS